MRKSTYTGELEAADKKRDELFRGLHSIVKGLLAQPDDAKQKAAEKEFLSYRAERAGESVAKPKEDLKLIRTQIDALYTATCLTTLL
ncbi:MAG: DUF6261 family protein [Tannerellaceae bacterium]|nr:DUF6261 family protein [Tannerellaceae bacterium]